VVAECSKGTLISHEESRRVIANPAALTLQPPIVLVELVFDRNFPLLTANLAIGSKGGSWKYGVVVLHPAVDVGVVAARCRSASD
jgi:hypothetical protein